MGFWFDLINKSYTYHSQFFPCSFPEGFRPANLPWVLLPLERLVTFSSAKFEALAKENTRDILWMYSLNFISNYSKLCLSRRSIQVLFSLYSIVCTPLISWIFSKSKLILQSQQIWLRQSWLYCYVRMFWRKVIVWLELISQTNKKITMSDCQCITVKLREMSIGQLEMKIADWHTSWLWMLEVSCIRYQARHQVYNQLGLFQYFTGNRRYQAHFSQIGSGQHFKPMPIK